MWRYFTEVNGSPSPWVCGYLKIQASVWTVQVRSSCPRSPEDAACWLWCSETGGVQGCWNRRPPARGAQRRGHKQTDKNKLFLLMKFFMETRLSTRGNIGKHLLIHHIRCCSCASTHFYKSMVPFISVYKITTFYSISNSILRETRSAVHHNWNREILSIDVFKRLFVLEHCRHFYFKSEKQNRRKSASSKKKSNTWLERGAPEWAGSQVGRAGSRDWWRRGWARWDLWWGWRGRSEHGHLPYWRWSDLWGWHYEGTPPGKGPRGLGWNAA